MVGGWWKRGWNPSIGWSIYRNLQSNFLGYGTVLLDYDNLQRHWIRFNGVLSFSFNPKPYLTSMSSLTVESIWIWNAYSSNDLAGLTEGFIASGGKGFVAAGGSLSAGTCGNPITGPISNPSPSRAITAGAGGGAGAGYIIGGCKTTVLSCK